MITLTGNIIQLPSMYKYELCSETRLDFWMKVWELSLLQHEARVGSTGQVYTRIHTYIHAHALLVYNKYICIYQFVLNYTKVRATSHLALLPGVLIPAWRRGEEECLVHTVVRMHLISNQLICKRQKMTISNRLSFIDDVC